VTHTYQILRDVDGIFSVLLDGELRASGISAGPATEWGDGIARGSLFTQAQSRNKKLGTQFDDVVARP
jgi:hypothetical protein